MSGSAFRQRQASSTAEVGRSIEVTKARSVEAQSEARVGRSVETTVERLLKISASSAAMVGRSIEAEVERTFQKSASSLATVGRSISTDAKRPREVGVSLSRSVSATSVASKRAIYPLVEGFSRDERWDRSYEDYSDLNYSSSATVYARARLELGATGILMESGGTGDGLAMAIVADRDNYGDPILGTERLVAMFGDGGSTSGTDVATLSHRLGLRFSGVDVNGDETVLEGDWTDDIQKGDRIGWSINYDTGSITSVSYDASDDETTLGHDGEYAGYDYSASAVYVLPGKIWPAWSADVDTGQCVLYVNGAPVDTDTISNSRLCGGDDGTIGDSSGGARDLGQGWSGSDYEYGGEVYWADIYDGETTGQVVPQYKTEEFSGPVVYRHEAVEYGSGVDLGKRSSARAYVNISDGSNAGGIIAHWGAGGDGAILYLHQGDLYLQVGDGGKEGGSGECREYNVEGGAHVIEWTANIPKGDLELWVDGQKVDDDYYLSYDGDIAGSDSDGIGRPESGLPENRMTYQEEDRGAEKTVAKVETFPGKTWRLQTFEKDISSTASVGRSIETSVERAKEVIKRSTSSTATVGRSVSTSVNRASSGGGGGADGETVTHDFESGDEGWVPVESGFGRTTTYARNGSYSYGGGVSGAQAGEIAYVEPAELRGGNQIQSLTFYYTERVGSYGGGLRLYDSGGTSVIAALTDNPQWKVYDGNGTITQLYDGGGEYQDWIKVEMAFDWGAGTADVTFTNESTGTSRTENGVDIGGRGVEKIQITNYQGGSFGSGDCYYWIDDLSFTLSSSSDGGGGGGTIGPSFDKTEATDYGYASYLNHNIEWSGGAGPFQLRIYKTDSQTTLLHTETDLSGGSDSGTNVMESSFGDSVYYVLEDANGKTAKKSVNVEEYSF
ncbi:hypothetical protein [Salinibacter ruber]|uniref:Uncharacterized protein n=1 Tax=Salinibacter ruber TaxID=146919 RepID=A0AAW5P7B6_9BACT|nr:hypothetical protein [Salinibacter ruber]MCS4157672.1 hypothetical protein [Salinibacter ruber]